jgi:hypothetical protein
MTMTMTMFEEMKGQIDAAKLDGLAVTHWLMGPDFREHLKESRSKDRFPSPLGNTCFGLPVVVTDAIARDAMVLMIGTNRIAVFFTPSPS